MLHAKRQRCQRSSIQIASGGLNDVEARKELVKVKCCRRFASVNSRFPLSSEDFEASKGDAMLSSDENGFLSGLCVECSKGLYSCLVVNRVCSGVQCCGIHVSGQSDKGLPNVASVAVKGRLLCVSCLQADESGASRGLVASPRHPLRIDDEKDSDDDLASNTDTDSSKPIIQGPLDSTLSLVDSKVRIGDSGSEVDRESVGSLDPLAAVQEATQALARLDLPDKLSSAVAQSDSDKLNNAIAQSDNEMFGSPAEIVLT